MLGDGDGPQIIRLGLHVVVIKPVERPDQRRAVDELPVDLCVVALPLEELCKLWALRRLFWLDRDLL